MATIIQKRYDTAANWTSTNPILAIAEEGYESDTSYSKVGDGVTAWASLPYLSISGGLSSSDIGVTVQAYDATNVVDADIGVTVQAYDADIAKTDVVQTYSKGQRGFRLASPTGVIDVALSNNFIVEPTANVTLANPLNIGTGQSGNIYIDATTYTVSFGTSYKFAGGVAPTLTGKCILAYYTASPTEVIISEVNNYA